MNDNIHIPLGDTIYYLQPALIMKDGTGTYSHFPHMPKIFQDTFFKCTVIEVTCSRFGKHEKPYNAVKYKLREDSTSYTFWEYTNDVYTVEQHRQLLLDKILPNETTNPIPTGNTIY